MTARALVRQIDVTRLVRGVAAAGQRITHVTMDPAGKIVILTDAAAAEAMAGGEENEWDPVLHEAQAQSSG